MQSREVLAGILAAINLFNGKNRELQKYFLFFFFLAVCGYLSIMISFYPYNDDYCRYITNGPVGTLHTSRHATFLIELLAYFSITITDVAPFSHVISCAILAYIAIIYIKTLRIEFNDKYSMLCIIPIIVNPYLFENMLYRFDNPFMVLALLCSVMAGYLSSFNRKQLLLAQCVFLLHSLFIYQPALSAYFLLFVYFFLMEFTNGTDIVKIFSKMRYWFFTMFITALLYCPFALCTKYCRLESGNSFIFPVTMENLCLIANNISNYLFNLVDDWSGNAVGKIFFLLIILFCCLYIVENFKNLKCKCNYIYRFPILLTLLFVLFLSPFGICIFMYVIVFEGNMSIYPRIIYCFGILMSMVLYKNYSVIRNVKFLKHVYAVFLLLFAAWNIIFVNSAGNVIHYNRTVQHNVVYDIAKDTIAIMHQLPDVDYMCLDGDVYSPVFYNFCKLYPIMHRIIPEKWNMPLYVMLGLCCPTITDALFKYEPIESPSFLDKYQSKTLLKSHIWYDIHLLDKHVLLVQLKYKNKYHSPLSALRLR